ncbi:MULTISPECIES: GNAT family N-acetyltransferase [Cupriavidus]
MSDSTAERLAEKAGTEGGCAYLCVDPACNAATLDLAASCCAHCGKTALRSGHLGGTFDPQVQAFVCGTCGGHWHGEGLLTLRAPARTGHLGADGSHRTLAPGNARHSESPINGNSSDMLSRLQTLLARWRRPFARPTLASPAERAPIAYEVVEHSRQFRVYAMRGDAQVGFCIASAYAPLDTCFVNDLQVFETSDRGQGIGTELVRRAWVHAGQPTVVPVNVVPEAALWWAKRTRDATLPIRLGLTLEHAWMLLYATQDARPPRASSAPAPQGEGRERAPRDHGGPPQPQPGPCELDRLPLLVVKAAPNHFKAITAPSPDFRATLHNSAGEQVGTAAYALSPLSDKVYVFEIRIPPEHQRCGYATALLWHLAREYGRPITPVQELHAARGFWHAARAWAPLGVTEPLWDLDAEAVRWAHLRPLAELLAQQIQERLYVRREPWHVAVGRGLDAEATPETASAARVEARDGPSPI